MMRALLTIGLALAPAWLIAQTAAGPDFAHIEIAARIGGEVVHEDELAGVAANPAEGAGLVHAFAIEDVDAAVAGIGYVKPALITIR